MGPDLAGRAGHRLLCGRLAGLLFSVGSLASIPVNQLFDPAVGTRTSWITALGIVSGLICLAIRWDRLSPLWLHAIPLVASIEVGITMWGVGQHAPAYQWFLVLIVVYWAFAFEHRWEVSLHLGFVIAVALYPIALVPEAVRANVIGQTVVAIPILMVAAGVVVYLRERLAATAAALADEARRDPLTGLWNRRLLEGRLDYEVTRHRRNGLPLSVIVLDLDGFKLVNDTLGHPVGDALLKQVAAAIEHTARDQDTVVRQGGDEFCVVAPETDAIEGAVLADRIKAALRELVAGGVPVSASAGVATFPADASSAELLLAQADAEQRRDKQAGRSRRGALSVVR
jgi:diguanylate cyclase (GGDEF)-like protein